MMNSNVILVGAGPGDPELLTLKALKAIQSADAILYDALISEEILEMIPDNCKTFNVGKRCGAHKMKQEEINEFLYQMSTRHKVVVRLKGGDPFIFGRGGEELEYLQQRNVETSVIPGITAAAGCAASCNIPLTHRGHGNSLLLHSGHASTGEFDNSHTDKEKQTQVFYMGMNQAESISNHLIAEGHHPDTEVAIICQGTRPNQASQLGTLATLPIMAEEMKHLTPGLIILGDVVSLASNQQQRLNSKILALTA
ncbi:MAG TPA: uroporphyrinogen-III C-methyltransferase [Oceanospirillales bacterium]|nr:uroporphyrinogen-III C-methyltransferase [Oleispira sp.]HCM06653.1 uroporphyrinogen-III C-methyltransferase [Oceanospirillales bacterium]